MTDWKNVLCGSDHSPWQRNAAEEVTNKINRVKEKHPTDLLTFDDLDAVVKMWTEKDDNDDRQEGTGVEVLGIEEED